MRAKAERREREQQRGDGVMPNADGTLQCERRHAGGEGGLVDRLVDLLAPLHARAGSQAMRSRGGRSSRWRASAWDRRRPPCNRTPRRWSPCRPRCLPRCRAGRRRHTRRRDGATFIACAAWSSGAGCGLACGVVSPPTTTARASREPQRRDDGSRESLELVGDDAPAQAARFDGVERVADALEQRRGLREARFIVGEEQLAQRRVFGMVRRDVHAAMQEAARAGRGVRAQVAPRERVRGRAIRECG